MQRLLVAVFLVGVGVLAAARPARAQTVLPRAGWVATGSATGGGTTAANAIDGSAGTRWTTGSNQTSGQWFSLDMITPRTISQVTLDQGSSSADYPRAFQVFVSNDAVTWGAPVASGTGTAGIVTIVFPTQTARFVGIVQTASGPSAWSIAELNVYGPGAVPTVALNPSGWGATASSTGGADVAARALDGLVSTRWSSGAPQATGQTFQLDLRAPQAITRLQLDAGPNPSDYPRAFQVFATNDTASWGAAIATATGTSALVQVAFAQKTARYLKIVLTGSSSNWWSIAELTVFGVGDFTPVAMALPRRGWTGTASVICPGDVPALAFDDNASTRFTTGVNQANGQTFTVDMQVSQSFTKLTLDVAGFTGDHPRGYQVSVSNNGTTWGAPIATGAGTTPLVTITFPSQTARYVKIVQTGASSTNWWSIAELNVYGVPPVELLRNGWVATASASSATAGSGIDGNLTTRWTTNAPQANGQWFQVDMRTAQTFDQILLDATGFSADYPRGYQVFASNSPTVFGAAIASGVATSGLVSIGFPTQSARYLRVVQTGSTSSWWSIAELNVFAAPAVVQIEDYLARTFYSKSDIAASFVSALGDAIDCIPFEAQHTVKAWRAKGFAIPTTWPSAPPAPAGTAPTRVDPTLAFAGQPDANGNPRKCGAGLVPVSRPTVKRIQDAGGVAAYKAAIASLPHPVGMQHPVQHDCWLNDKPGGGTPETSDDWEHAVVLQNSGFLPAGATGYFGARATFPVYHPYMHADGEHTNAQWWIQSGTCNNWFNDADALSGDQTKNQCRHDSSCTTCTGAACDGCAVQSMEMTPVLFAGNEHPKLGVFFTSDGYYARNCWAGIGLSCAGCPIDPLTNEATDCYMATPGAKYAAGMGLNVNRPDGTLASQYGVDPVEITITAWNGSATGTPGWFLWVNEELIGMYPPGTFNWPDGTPGPLSNGPATYLQAGGEVYHSWPNDLHTNTSMWSDNHAEGGYKYAAYVRNLSYLDSTKTAHDAVVQAITTPAAEGDLGIPGLCGLTAGNWMDFTGNHGSYSGSLAVPGGDVPAGADGWGSYYYFGGGMQSRDVSPGIVAINVSQYAACDLVPTPQGNVTAGPNGAYLVIDLDGISNNASRAIPFNFDPKQLYVVDPVTGVRDHVDPALPLTQEIFGPFAAVPMTTSAGASSTFQLALHMAARVTTTNPNGPVEANAKKYQIKYERKPGDPQVFILDSTSATPNHPVHSNCREIGLTNP